MTLLCSSFLETKKTSFCIYRTGYSFIARMRKFAKTRKTKHRLHKIGDTPLAYSTASLTQPFSKLAAKIIIYMLMQFSAKSMG